MTTRSTKWTYPTPRPEVLAKQKVVMIRMATDGLMVSLLGSTEYRLCQDGDFYMLNINWCLVTRSPFEA